MDWFNKAETTTLKGICIILVFLHHFTQYIGYQNYYTFFMVIGPLAVDIFFFIAGYTTILQLEKSSPAQLRYFLYNRALRVYLPITVFSLPYNNFLSGLLYMYIVSWIAYRFLESKLRMPFIVAMNILFIVICILLRIDIWWYDRIIPFCFGALFAVHKDKMATMLNYKVLRYSIFVFSTIGILFCGKEMGKWTQLYLAEAILLSFFACIFVASFYFIVDFANKPLNFLGSISFEFFILHQFLFILLDKVLANHYLLLVISFIVSTISAYLLYTLWNKMLKRFRLIKCKRIHTLRCFAVQKDGL